MHEIDIVHFFCALQKTDLQKGEPSDSGKCAWSPLDDWDSFLRDNLEHHPYVPSHKLLELCRIKELPKCSRDTERRHLSRLSLILLMK
jgi:hypothetical protein